MEDKPHDLPVRKGQESSVKGFIVGFTGVWKVRGEMFTLWYSVLSYKEYRNSIEAKLSQKPPPLDPKPPGIITPPASTTPQISRNIPVPNKIQPPPKPPRSPSPHPLKDEAFEIMDSSEESEAEDDDDDDEDEDEEENSVIDSLHRTPQHFVNSFLKTESESIQQER